MSAEYHNVLKCGHVIDGPLLVDAVCPTCRSRKLVVRRSSLGGNRVAASTPPGLRLSLTCPQHTPETD